MLRKISTGWFGGHKVKMLILLGSVISGCSVRPARLTNIENEACSADVKNAIQSILIAEGENPMYAITAGVALKVRMQQENPSNFNGFDLTAPSQKHYYFMIKKSGACSLKLYKTKTGNSEYTNTLTFIQSEDLPNCQCEE